MSNDNHDAGAVRPLTERQLQQFVEDGFVRLDDAFDAATAAAAREILWRQLPERPDDPATWTRPAVRLGMFTDPPFVAAANTVRLRAAFDQLVGAGRWRRCGAVGTFRIAFPSTADPGDLGWHVDVSFGYDHPDFMQWRVNLRSRGRWLLVLMLFSDVGEEDAPTRLRAGSHLDIARRLAPAGDAGLSLADLAAHDFELGVPRTEAVAVGEAGTVYLCHPFLVHAAQPHRGSRPRFLAQPPLLPESGVELDLGSEAPSPVEAAIVSALRS